MGSGGGLWTQLGLYGLIAGAALLVGIGFGNHGASGSTALLALAALALSAVVMIVGLAARRRRSTAARRPADAPAEANGGQAGQPPHRDALTGLLTRAVLVERLQRRLKGARQRDRMVAVLRIDLTDFGRINETLGHAAGDVLLRHAAARVLGAVREIDVVGRVGADEFAIVQAQVDRPEAAASLCERVLQAIEEPFDLCGRQAFVGAAIGIALSPADGGEADELLDHAAAALERARSEGGSTYRFSDEDTDAHVHRRLALTRDLAQALEREELALQYRPRFDVATRRPVAVTASLCWRHPRHGLLGPDVVGPLAEESGELAAINAWALEQVCARGSRWIRAREGNELHVAIGLAPAQVGDPGLAGPIEQVLERAGLPARALELVVPGRALADACDCDVAALARLRDLGVRMSVSGVGGGHASLAHLYRVPFDALGIERALVRDVDQRRAAGMVRALVTLGHELDLSVVAEGVETAEQLAFLAAEGCPLAEGPYFGPPVSAREIDALLLDPASGPAGPAEEGTQKIA